MFCQFCGERIPDDSKFCPVCGERVLDFEESPDADSAATAEVPVAAESDTDASAIEGPADDVAAADGLDVECSEAEEPVEGVSANSEEEPEGEEPATEKAADDTEVSDTNSWPVASESPQAEKKPSQADTTVVSAKASEINSAPQSGAAPGAFVAPASTAPIVAPAAAPQQESYQAPTFTPPASVQPGAYQTSGFNPPSGPQVGTYTPPQFSSTTSLPNNGYQPAAMQSVQASEPKKKSSSAMIGMLLAIAAVGITAFAVMKYGGVNGDGSAGLIQPANAPDAASDGRPVQRGDLSEYSWDELAAIAKLIEDGGPSAAEDIARSYGLLDSRGRCYSSVKTLSMEDGKKVGMRLVGVYHDRADVAGGKAGLTFLADEIQYHHRMSPLTTMPGGWGSSELRKWLNNDLYKLMPAEVEKAIVPAVKSTNNDGPTTSTNSVTDTKDKIWVPSIVELTGRIDWVFESNPSNSGVWNAVFNAEGPQLPAFAEMHIESADSNGVFSHGEEWWTRSTSSASSRGRYVGSDGTPSRFGDANQNLGVIFGFCL